MGDKNYQIDIREVLSRKYAGGYAKQEFLQLPDRYRMIGDGAFQDNIRIERLDLSDRLQVIGRNAFRHSIALKEVRLPRSVERLSYKQSAAVLISFSIFLSSLPVPPNLSLPDDRQWNYRLPSSPITVEKYSSESLQSLYSLC